MDFDPEPDLAALLAVERGRRETIAAALPAAHAGLAKLVECCATKIGQGDKLRALVSSLWNGKPAPLIEITGLDFDLREALLAVLRCVGSDSIFFETVQDAFKFKVSDDFET